MAHRSWNESTTLEFVKTYMKYDCLWNPEHPSYKIKFHREKAYRNIASEFKSITMMSLTPPEVKIKIKHLRTTYMQQVNKIIQKSTPDCIYEPSLVWFHEMDQYLKRISTNRHSVSNVQKTSEVDSSCQVWIDMQTKNVEEADTNPLVAQSDDEYENEIKEEITVRNEEENKPLPIQNHYKRNKKKKMKRRKSLKDYSSDSNSESLSKEDEFDIYGKFVATQLRKLNLQKALRLQLQIQNLISEARLSDIHSE